MERTKKLMGGFITSDLKQLVYFKSNTLVQKELHLRYPITFTCTARPANSHIHCWWIQQSDSGYDHLLSLDPISFILRTNVLIYWKRFWVCIMRVWNIRQSIIWWTINISLWKKVQYINWWWQMLRNLGNGFHLVIPKNLIRRKYTNIF